jgi:hypothetical protein
MVDEQPHMAADPFIGQQECSKLHACTQCMAATVAIPLRLRTSCVGEAQTLYRFCYIFFLNEKIIFDILHSIKFKNNRL